MEPAYVGLEPGARQRRTEAGACHRVPASGRHGILHARGELSLVETYPAEIACTGRFGFGQVLAQAYALLSGLAAAPFLPVPGRGQHGPSRISASISPLSICPLTSARTCCKRSAGNFDNYDRVSPIRRYFDAVFCSATGCCKKAPTSSDTRTDSFWTAGRIACMVALPAPERVIWTRPRVAGTTSGRHRISRVTCTHGCGPAGCSLVHSAWYAVPQTAIQAGVMLGFIRNRFVGSY